MKESKRLHPVIRLIAVVCAIVLLPLGGAGMKVSAAGGTANLTVTWTESGEAFKLYHVAELQKDGTYKYTSDFEKYSNIKINKLTQEELESAATQLAAYAVRDKITELKKGMTDDKGSCTFEGLPYGAYMIIGSSTIKDNGVTTVPSFVYLEKDMEVQIKPEMIPDETLSYEVYKVWKDDGYKDERPEEITVQLVREDGTVVNEDVLSEDNDWYVEWTDLPKAKYRVVEVEDDELEGYKTSVVQEGKVWTVTNTYTPPKDGTTTTSTTETRKKIPQTGQLWWPIPLLCSAAFLCMIIGVLRRRSNGNKDE